MRLKAASFRAAVCARVSYSGALGEGKGTIQRRFRSGSPDRPDVPEQYSRDPLIPYLGRPFGAHSGLKVSFASQRMGSSIDRIASVMCGKSIFQTSSPGW